MLISITVAVVLVSNRVNGYNKFAVYSKNFIQNNPAGDGRGIVSLPPLPH